MSNQEHIRELERKLADKREERFIARAKLTLYFLMVVILVGVALTLGFIRTEVAQFEEDCMNQLMYIRQDINDMCTYECTIAEIEDYDLTERNLIERVVAAEARGESYEGMLAVAQTIKDRGDLWGMSYTEVVTAPAQFANPYQGEVSAEVKQAVADVFDNGARAFEEPVTHFHNGTVSPSWANAHTFRGQIGSHYFYG